MGAPTTRVLVTGATGYIGTHTMVELLAAGCDVVGLDNYVNSLPEAAARVAAIVGRPVPVIEGDVRDAAALGRLFAAQRIDAVIHFAALKAVGESVAQPLRYYDNNVVGTLRLLEAMQAAGVRRLVFSSSATVYGEPSELPLTEAAAVRPTNPYGATKAAVERLLADLTVADPRWSCVSLRYFNPIGAHPSGRIGEDPADVPNNLFPYVTQVAAGRRPRLAIFGDDWPTVDGTGVRDYLHVMDLAAGHVAALHHTAVQPGHTVINLGTGQGTSVLQLVAAFEQANGLAIPHEFVARRPGDLAACWADAQRAEALLGWRARRTVADACRDGWAWQRANPHGYRSA